MTANSTKIDEKELDGEYLLEWGWDECADSPRDRYDNVGHLYTWSRDCESPDECACGSPEEFVAQELHALFTQEELEGAVREGRLKSLRFNANGGEERLEALYRNCLTGKTDWDEVAGYGQWRDLETLANAISQCAEAPSLLREKGVRLNVYRLEHSGVAYSTNPFNDRWDSGQVGFIWARRDELEEMGYDNDAVVEKMFADEVKTYSAWANGEVYWANLWKNGTCVSSYGNIIGDDELDDAIRMLTTEAENMAEAHATDTTDKANGIDVAELKRVLEEAQAALQNAMRLLEGE